MNEMEMNENIEIVETVEKPYNLRRLKDGDLWPVLDIISKVFPDDLSDVFSKVLLKEKGLAEIGASAIVQIVIAVIKNMGKVHDEVYALLSDVSGIPADEIKEMEFGTAPMMIWDIVTNEKNSGFFKVVSKLS